MARFAIVLFTVAIFARQRIGLSTPALTIGSKSSSRLRSGLEEPAAGVGHRAGDTMNIRAEIQNFLRDERAATAIEYGLIAALISVTLISILRGLGGQMSTVFSEISSATK
jgi:pilus assembly protein Flp/PilA